MVLDHAEGAGGHPLAVLKLPQRPLGHPGRFRKSPPVPHAQFDPARDDVIGEPLPVLIGHMTVLPRGPPQSPIGQVTILTRRGQKSLPPITAGDGPVPALLFSAYLTVALYFLSVPVYGI